MNAATDERLVQLAKVAAQGILDKLHDEKKATWKYLSISGSPLSYRGCPEEVKEGLQVVRLPTIGARAPLEGQLTSCRNMAI